MIRDQLASVKASVKLVDVLKRHGVSVPADTESQISCPFHGVDSHPSARVYANTNTLFCFTCHHVYDVISVEMAFLDCDLKTAVESLISAHNVIVEEQPQDIQRFYSHVVRYTRGDNKQVSAVILELGDRFRCYYTSMSGWRLLGHLIDYFWQEFDALAADTPVELLALVMEWFASAHAMIASQMLAVEIIHPYVADES
jgi:hypothetical protein